MFETLTDGLLPRASVVAAAAATLLVVVGGLLLQSAARLHRAHQRQEALRARVARVEARWHEATR